MSNHSDHYYINTIDYEELELKNIYITDILKIISPNNNQEFSLKDNFTIEWEKDEIAEYYHLVISKIKREENEESTNINIYQITDNRISFSDIESVVTIEGEINYDHWTKMGRFKRITGVILPGQYKITVSGYVLLPDQERYVYTTDSENVVINIKK